MVGALCALSCAGGGGSGGEGGSGSATDCDEIGHGTSAEIAATPRADIVLEQLAIVAGSGVTADPAIYDRIVRDVAAIREAEPAVAHIDYFPADNGKTVFLATDDETYEATQAGDYHAWDCLNDHYVMENVEWFDLISHVAVTLKGSYDISIVASDYATLDGVASATASGTLGDGSTICLDASSDTWLWVFDEASGDCPAGCIDHLYWHFTSQPNGNVAFVERWSNADPTTRPSWVSICL
jgi:hypothetical protein